MRCLIARLLAMATGVLIVAMSLLFGFLQNRAAARPDVAAGRRVYDREDCAMCHSIAGQGSRRHPLDGVGGRLGKADIRRWIVSPREMKPDVRKPSYEISPEDLDALVEYLAGLE